MTDISKILADLYNIDPSFRDHEADLTKLIQELLLSRPDTKFDEAFAQTLCTRLLAESSAVHPAAVVQKYVMSMKKMIVTLLGSAAVVAAAFVIIIFSNRMNVPTVNLAAAPSVPPAGVHSKRLADNAFGSLVGADESGAADHAQLTAGATIAPTAAPKATFELAAPALLDTKMMAQVGIGGGTTGVANSAMIARPYYGYTFVYKGDPIKLTDKTVDVFRRIKPGTGRPDLAQALAGVSIGGVNLGSFTGSNLTNFEVKQNTADGYTVSINLIEGTVGISRSTAFAVTPMPLTVGSAGTAEPAIPADTVLITAAKNFLSAHSVDVSNYGDAIVQNEWRDVMPVTSESARPTAAPANDMLRVYYPQNITVLFPRKVGSALAYDQGGTPSGITVNVNIQNNQVESVWGVQTNDYESSAYAAETNADAILKVVSRGGMFGSDPVETFAALPQIELGTPERVYMVYWKYSSNENQELLVPALRFPVTKVPAGTYYYQKSVVVPIVQELLESQPYPGPIMYMKGADGVSSGSAGSAVVVPPTEPKIAPAPTK